MQFNASIYGRKSSVDEIYCGEERIRLIFMSNITLDDLNHKLDIILHKMGGTAECDVLATRGELDSILDKIKQYQKESKDPNFTQSLNHAYNEALSLKNRIASLSQSIDKDYCVYLKNQELLCNNVNLELPRNNFNIYSGLKEPIGKRMNEKENRIQKEVDNQQVKKSKIEYRIGGELFGVLGAIFILISLITLGKTLLPAFLQGIALFLIPVIVLALGEVFEKRISSKFARIVTAIGISSAYIAVLINYLYMKNIGDLIALGLIILITAASLYISKKKQNLLIKIISLIGFYLSLLSMCNLKTNMEAIMISFCLLFISVIDLVIKVEDKKHIYDYFNLIFHVLISAGIMTSILVSTLIGLRFTGKPVVFSDISLLISLSIIFTSFLIIICKAKKERNFNVVSFLLLCLELLVFMAPIKILWTSSLELISIGFVVMSLIFYMAEKEKQAKWIYLYPILLIWLPIFSSNLIGKASLIELFGPKYLLLMTVVLIYMGISGRISRETKIKILNTVSLIIFLFSGIALESTYCLPFIVISILYFLYAYHYEGVSLVFFIPIVAGYVTKVVTDFTDISGVKIFGACIEIIMIMFAFLFTKIEKTKHEKTYQNLYVLMTVCAAGFLFQFTKSFPLWIISVICTISLIYLLNAVNTRIAILDKHKLKIYAVVSTLFIFLMPNTSGYLISILTILLATISIYIGFMKTDKGLRLYGLILSLIMIMKLMLIDLASYSNINKIILFFICGILILSISFIYIKLEKKISKDP